jgi:hypothetical protein
MGDTPDFYGYLVSGERCKLNPLEPSIICNRVAQHRIQPDFKKFIIDDRGVAYD